VVVNWSGIRHISSTSLGAAMKGASDVSKQGRQYRNCEFSERAALIVKAFRNSFPWNYFETEQQAVTACSSADVDDARPTVGT
jgi:anti-anti-sigma regulatory factor